MAESSGGEMESLSKRDIQKELKCISCAAFISPPFKVCSLYRGTPQQKCINSQCGAALIPGANLCFKCAAPQDIVCLECGAHQHTQSSRQQLPSQVDQPSSDPHTTQSPLQASPDPHTTHPPLLASPDPHITHPPLEASPDPHTTHPPLLASPDPHTTHPPPEAFSDPHNTHPLPQASPDQQHNTQPPPHVDQPSPDPCTSQVPGDLSSNNSQSGMSAIPLEASSDGENSFHTPPSTSPQSSFSVEGNNNTEDDIGQHRIPAFNPPQNKVINVYFKAVLRKTAWEWDNSSVSIHFNQLNIDVGPGSCSDVDDDEDLLLVEFDLKMHIDVFVRYKYIIYKYLVYSRREEEVKHPYEYLYGAEIEGVADTRFINRALKIDEIKCFPGG